MAIYDGFVSVSNCYSRGDVTGSQNSAGICGRLIGASIVLTNVYASGRIIHSTANGLIGRTFQDANQVNISMSVCDGYVIHDFSDSMSKLVCW